MGPPVLVKCLGGVGPVLGAGSGWLLSSLVEDLFILEVLEEPSLLDWRQRENK